MMNMSSIGIWLDNRVADLIDLSSNSITLTLYSELNGQSSNSKKIYHRSAELYHNYCRQEKFYERITSKILTFNSVLLFGPNTVKLELLDFLLKDKRFNSVAFYVKSVDELTEYEKICFVKNHFNNTLDLAIQH